MYTVHSLPLQKWGESFPAKLYIYIHWLVVFFNLHVYKQATAATMVPVLYVIQEQHEPHFEFFLSLESSCSVVKAFFFLGNYFLKIYIISFLFTQ
jgi:hypothetical protein